jgi:hypothetical protein
LRSSFRHPSITASTGELWTLKLAANYTLDESEIQQDVVRHGALQAATRPASSDHNNSDRQAMPAEMLMLGTRESSCLVSPGAWAKGEAFRRSK